MRNKMVDAIIVLIVIVLLIFALKGTLKHFKGESPCCGGGSGLIKTEIEEKVLDHPLHEPQLPLHPAQPTGFPSLWFL